jgi:hypothetical protein
MTRRRRETTTAGQIQAGDIIEPHSNGYRATVDWTRTPENCTEPTVSIHWTYPSDFTVNARTRGQSSGCLSRPGDPMTRWSTP